MNDLPTPKFRIGDTVYTAEIETVTKRYPCPDCLGTGKWTVETPAGSKMETPCLRCGSYSNTDLPSLFYTEAVARAQPFEIRTVSVKSTPDSWSPELVEYSNRPHGGSCSYQTLPQGKAFATEAEALAAAEIMASLKNAEAKQEPERITKERIGAMPLNDARFDQFKNGLWSAVYAFRSIRDKIQGLYEDIDSGTVSKVSEVKEALEDWEKFDFTPKPEGYATLNPLEVLVRAAEALPETDETAAIKAALADLPQPQRLALGQAA